MSNSDPRATQIRVLIVDDQQMFREGIRHRLSQEPDMKVVGEAASAEEALAMVPETEPTSWYSTYGCQRSQGSRRRRSFVESGRRSRSSC